MSIYGDFVQKHIARDSVFGIPINRETTIDSALDFLLLSDNIAYDEREIAENTRIIEFAWGYKDKDKNGYDISIPVCLSGYDKPKETFILSFEFFKTEEIERIQELKMIFDFDDKTDHKDIRFIFNEIYKILLNKIGLPHRDGGHFKPPQFADAPLSLWRFKEKEDESRWIKMTTDCNYHKFDTPQKSIILEYRVNFRKPTVALKQ